MNEDEEEDGSSTSSTASKTTSLLPVSTGPDDLKYSFSSFPTPSPPVSSPGSSSNSSTEKLYLQNDSNFSDVKKASSTSSFCLDQSKPATAADDSSSKSCSCLMELLEWFVLRCCNCCHWNLNAPEKLHHS